jgi:monoamine oxidase
MQTDYDVIVVGGGFAGVAAARDCRKYGLRTLLLEARNRLGGRTFATQWNGHHIEMGGAWVHWLQPSVWSEIQRYGLDIIQSPGVDVDRVIARADNFFTDTPYSRVAAQIGAACDEYFADARVVWERPWDAHFQWDKLVANEHVTTLDRLSQLKLSKLQRTALQSILEACSHARIGQGSYLEMARCYALGGWTWSVFADVLQRYQIKDGTGELIKRMIEDGAPDVRLSSPIRRIEQSGDVVNVTTNAGQTVSGRAVVLAVPMNCLTDIECIPALSSGKVTASRERHAGAGIKVYAEIRGRHGRPLLMAPSKYRLGYAFTYQELPNSTLIVGFGSDPQDLDPNDEASVQTSLRQFIPDAEVIASTSYSWVRDPFSLGTYCSYRPGRVTQWFDDLRRQEGRVYMAGSDFAEGSRGFIDGAIASGVRTANQVAKSLIA